MKTKQGPMADDRPRPAPSPQPPREPLPAARKKERIAKVMARAGVCSRRDAEEWIAAGRVSVNGKVIDSPALNVREQDRIVVDGQPLPERERTRLFLYNKPRGLVTTHADPEGRPTIFEALPADLPRLISVGRLDLTTEGLLLLTNDGGLARILELPSTGWLRRYRVRAHGEVTQPDLDKLRDGITVEGVRYGGIEATLDRPQGANVWLTFAIREGKNREVRNVLGALGLEVNRLIRLSFGPFQLAELPEGEIEEVKMRVLREQLGERIANLAGVDFEAPIQDAPARRPVPDFEIARPSAPRRGRDGAGPSAAPAPRPQPTSHGRQDRFAQRLESRREARPETRPEARSEKRPPREERRAPRARDDRRPNERQPDDARRPDRQRTDRPQPGRQQPDRQRNDRPRTDRPRDEAPRGRGKFSPRPMPGGLPPDERGGRSANQIKPRAWKGARQTDPGKRARPVPAAKASAKNAAAWPEAQRSDAQSNARSDTRSDAPWRAERPRDDKPRGRPPAAGERAPRPWKTEAGRAERPRDDKPRGRPPVAGERASRPWQNDRSKTGRSTGRSTGRTAERPPAEKTHKGRSDSRPDHRSDSRPNQRPDSRNERRPDARPDNRPEHRPDSRPPGRKPRRVSDRPGKPRHKR